jgi:hypothetical protein
MLVDFGAVSILPGMVAVSLIREMDPVITALICAGKTGSGTGAEFGSMRTLIKPATLIKLIMINKNVVQILYHIMYFFHFNR